MVRRSEENDVARCAHYLSVMTSYTPTNGLRMMPWMSLAWLPLVLCAASMSATTAHAQRKSTASISRIAVFDSRLLIDSMPERAAVESEFALEQAKARTMLREASDSLRATLESFLKEESRLSPREREAGSLHLRSRELLVEEMAANLDGIILQRRDELREPMLLRIRAAVRTVRERERFAVVFDLASSAGVVDVDPTADVTLLVLQELRRPTTR